VQLTRTSLLTGHPDRAPRDLVFLADLTVELRAWPKQTWTAIGVSPEAALLAVVDRWRVASRFWWKSGGRGLPITDLTRRGDGLVDHLLLES